MFLRINHAQSTSVLSWNNTTKQGRFLQVDRFLYFLMNTFRCAKWKLTTASELTNGLRHILSLVPRLTSTGRCPKSDCSPVPYVQFTELKLASALFLRIHHPQNISVLSWNDTTKQELFLAGNMWRYQRIFLLLKWSKWKCVINQMKVPPTRFVKKSAHLLFPIYVFVVRIQYSEERSRIVGTSTPDVFNLFNCVAAERASEDSPVSVVSRSRHEVNLFKMDHFSFGSKMPHTTVQKWTLPVSPPPKRPVYVKRGNK